ncbi:hypothetical protein N7489_003396 [Penicillium chrysogenum]|uniref:uncharacterized protein n=1 Tax=Penicillium chrysogenum TaxID=5076 RepID=UPI0024DF0D17|nr:uncharacterized protein N7489_003396 [Penicillium chrysogenum]KAJ5252986.1 hypothetical protein N7489_003396 [Penicillium chrysogenum]
MSRQPINLISDTESESESDGGMQLDDLDRVDGIPMFGSEGDGLNVDGIPMSRPGRDDDDWDVNGDTSNESDTNARTRSHLRDEKHAALAVLMDNELLVTYALASQETIPQTRRRFLAKYLAPNDPAKAEELYDPRFYIAPDGKGGEGSLIRGRYREVIGDINDHNWHKPAHLRAMDAKKARGGGSRSGSGSRSCSGANSPGAFGGVGLGAGEGRGGGGASLVGRGLGQGRGRGVDEDEDEDL